MYSKLGFLGYPIGVFGTDLLYPINPGGVNFRMGLEKVKSRASS